ncbi:MAG: DeoR/GlpR family DNA-binding transcription regulator [Chloroflexota bacterium]
MRELTHEIAQFYQTREVSNLPEKQRIGQAAARLIQQGTTIALSGGSTPLQVARHMPTDTSITVVTNDLNIVQVLANHLHLEIFVPGGYLRLGRENLVGANAITALDGLDIAQVFLTVTGLDLDVGATAGHIGNVVYLRALVARAKQCIVIADHTKFENPPQIVICGWEDVDMLISDRGLAPTLQQNLEAKGVKVILA